jgi:hypothetical protein
LPADPDQNQNLPFIYVALPVMNEPGWLNKLLECLNNQHYSHFCLVACVNQPDNWWDSPEKKHICINNQESIQTLVGQSRVKTVILDHSSKGSGWTGKRHGVGMARKTAMDYISKIAAPNDIILSLDADTTFSEFYLDSIAGNFQKHPGMVALAVPYYHCLTGEESSDRAILRYEIYMRHYFLNLAFIGSPYAFTALGSAMALPVHAYRAIGGMTPKLSGEDFYFLQKLRKFGTIGLWNCEIVHPASRFSDRVFFGTGPAMIKGATGDWTSYPIYPLKLFREIADTYSKLEELYKSTVPSRVTEFLSQAFREDDPLMSLRENHRDLPHFIRAFHEKFDGLRILQYLKTNLNAGNSSNEASFSEFLEHYFPQTCDEIKGVFSSSFCFQTATLEELARIREFLFRQENDFRATAKPG